MDVLFTYAAVPALLSLAVSREPGGRVDLASLEHNRAHEGSIHSVVPIAQLFH